MYTPLTLSKTTSIAVFSMTKQPMIISGVQVRGAQITDDSTATDSYTESGYTEPFYME